jgi:hypothetical protein
MEGHEVYNRSSRVQAAGLSPAVRLLEQCHLGLELLGGPMAERSAGAHPRSGTGCLQSRPRRARVNLEENRSIDLPFPLPLKTNNEQLITNN